jgi:hypothetical protein
MEKDRGGGSKLEYSYLWGLRFDLPSTSKRSVDFTHDCGLRGLCEILRLVCGKTI